MAKTGPKGPMKPLSDRDLEKVKELAHIQCTRAETAAVMGMSINTLTQRLRERGYKTLDSFLREHREQGKASLRRMQWKNADSGNTQMQIHLGKNMLGQSDKVQQDQTVRATTAKIDIENLKDLTDEELAALERAATKLGFSLGNPSGEGEENTDQQVQE